MKLQLPSAEIIQSDDRTCPSPICDYLFAHGWSQFGDGFWYTSALFDGYSVSGEFTWPEALAITMFRHQHDMEKLINENIGNLTGEKSNQLFGSDQS